MRLELQDAMIDMPRLDVSCRVTRRIDSNIEDQVPLSLSLQRAALGSRVAVAHHVGYMVFCGRYTQIKPENGRGFTHIPNNNNRSITLIEQFPNKIITGADDITSITYWDFWRHA